MESNNFSTTGLEALSNEELLTTMENTLLERRHEDLSQLTPDQQFSIITERAEVVIPQEQLLSRLRRSKDTRTPMLIKLGIDPTGAELHLGHMIPLIIASRFQRMGHNIALIIGDFTAQIGDPSGRVASRPFLSEQQVRENARTYIQQVAPFIDISRIDALFNSEWLSKVSLSDFFKILSDINVAESLQREDFRKRMEEGGLTQAELLYSVVMAIDSAHIEPDLEIGGTDQLLNMQMCRKVMGLQNEDPEVLLTTSLLPGTTGDGKKMSKSLQNYVGVEEGANDVYGKILSIPDTLFETYLKVLTEIHNSEWNLLLKRIQESNLNPMEVKRMLARLVVSMLHTRDAAFSAEADFTSRFSRKEYINIAPEDTYDVTTHQQQLGDFIFETGIVTSRNELRRLFSQDAVQVIVAGNDSPLKITDQKVTLEQIGSGSYIIRIGKRKAIKVNLI